MKAVPTVDLVENSHSISDDVEIILEFYDEFDIILNEIEELENSLLLLEEIETDLDEIDSSLIDSDSEVTSPVLGFINILIPFADAASKTIDDESRTEIANTKQQIQQLKDKFVSLKATNSLDEKTIKDLDVKVKQKINSEMITVYSD